MTQPVTTTTEPAWAGSAEGGDGIIIEYGSAEGSAPGWIKRTWLGAVRNRYLLGSVTFITGFVVGCAL